MAGIRIIDDSDLAFAFVFGFEHFDNRELWLGNITNRLLFMLANTTHLEEMLER